MLQELKRSELYKSLKKKSRRKTGLEDKSFGIRAWGIRGVCNLADNKWPVRD